MGYSGATYLIQEVSNALFDMLFHILPLASQMDKVDATLAKPTKPLPWTDDAKTKLEAMVDEQPVLIRISVAKRLRDRAEREARLAGVELVSDVHVVKARDALLEGASA
jgi:chlorophyllide a reductase subunit Z